MKRDSLKLIEVLKEWDEDFINGAVLLHFDKETRQLKSISPVIPAESMKELIAICLDACEALNAFAKNLIEKQLPKN